MSEPFLGEVRIFSFDFPPKGWAMCNGQILAINQNQALFSILGTMYGGDGQINFALPDLRGRVPFHMGNGLTQSQSGGEEAHTLTLAEMTLHNHALVGSNDAPNVIIPGGSLPAATPFNLYANTTANLSSLAPGSIAPTGGNQPHSNMQPYLVLNLCIALAGIFPSRN